MIEPFGEQNVGIGVVSYGLSSYGYDIRVARGFKNFYKYWRNCCRSKKYDEKNVVDFIWNVYELPNSFALARTVEYFNMPKMS